MSTRRRIDLCTCGKSREDVVHGPVTVGCLPGEHHPFHPNPQPPPIPTNTVGFHRIYALRLNGVWVADVYDGTKIGRGQAAQWLDAVNAGIEDLKEKQS